MMGVNYIGHYYLYFIYLNYFILINFFFLFKLFKFFFFRTILLLDKIKSTKGARIINVSSSAHKNAMSNFIEDINFENGEFVNYEQYSNSKLANNYFTKILQRFLLNGFFFYFYF